MARTRMNGFEVDIVCSYFTYILKLKNGIAGSDRFCVWGSINTDKEVFIVWWLQVGKLAPNVFFIIPKVISTLQGLIQALVPIAKGVFQELFSSILFYPSDQFWII